MNTKTRRLRSFIIAFTGFTLIGLASSHAATVLQSTSQNNTGDNWNATAAWGGTAPVPGNDYVSNPTATGAFAATATGLGVSVTSRVRDTGTAFGGNSLTIVSATEALLRNTAGPTNTANIILNDGTVRVVGSTTLAGALSTTTTGIVGLGGTNTLTINSALTGNGTFNLRASDTSPTIFLAGNLSGFTGALRIGGGDAGFVKVDFNQDYVIPAALVMGTFSTVDVLNLDQAVTVKSFQFGAASAQPGVYTAMMLNSLYGNGSQFTGPGTLTVPEPSSAVLGLLGSLLVFRRRRRA